MVHVQNFDVGLGLIWSKHLDVKRGHILRGFTKISNAHADQNPQMSTVPQIPLCSLIIHSSKYSALLSTRGSEF